MSTSLRAAALWCATLSSCALTLSGGPTNAGPHHPMAAGVALGASTHAFRQGSSVFGFRLLTTVDHGFAIRSGMLHAGYDVRLLPGWIVFEPGVDLGAGSPVRGGFGGIGSYAGVAGNFRIRVLGIDDSQPAFNVYAVSGELVVLSRFGGWMPPEASGYTAMRWEWGVEIGLRLAVGSDLVSAAQGQIADTDSSESSAEEP